MARKSTSHTSNGPPDFCDYGVGVLAERLDKMLAQTEGAESGRDTRAIHQMRVWSRRSRAALDVFEPCFAHGDVAAFTDITREVKTVTRALGAARDLDVMLETLQARRETLPADQRGGVDSFLDYLQAQRSDRQQAVTCSVRHLVKKRLKQRLYQLADKHGYKAVTVELPSAAVSAASNGASEPDNAAPASGQEVSVNRNEVQTEGEERA